MFNPGLTAFTEIYCGCRPPGIASMKMHYMNPRLMLKMIILSTLLKGCIVHHYKAEKIRNSQEIPGALRKGISQGKTFILRSPRIAQLVTEIAPDSSTGTVALTTSGLTAINKRHVSGARNSRYRVNRDTALLKEVHLYTDDSSVVESGSYRLPMGKIRRIEVLKKDKPKSVGLSVIGTALIMATAAAGTFLYLLSHMGH